MAQQLQGMGYGMSPSPVIVQQPQAMKLSERVELFVACGDLIYSNTFCVVSMKHAPEKEFEIIDKTEVIEGNQNPARWTKRFHFDYFFEEEQILCFKVYTTTKKGLKTNKIENHKLVGTATIVLGEIFSQPGSIMQKKLLVKGYPVKNRKNKRWAHVLVFCGKLKSDQDTRNLTLAFGANKLIQADKASLSDPYFIISRNKTPIYGDRNKHIKNTIYPKWPPFNITTQHLCNNDPHEDITIEMWDWDKNDKSGDDFLGKVTLTMDQMKQRPKGIEVKNDRRKNKKNKKNQFGTFDVITYKSASSFIDYLQGGVDMSLMVALDFTASNGHPSDIKSLHCIQDPQSGQPVISAYQHAIRVIGNIVSIYDADQMYPVWGFGLNVPSEGANALHSFNLNFNKDNPEVHGIHGIEQIYVNAVNAISTTTIIPSGPTFFTPILKKAATIALKAHQGYMKKVEQNPRTKPEYFILLMITDGVIDDMKQTIDILVKIANEKIPLSIIIVGVGNEDFTKMEILDADDEPLKDSQGNTAYRDIVQFLPFNKVAAANDMSLLAKETLVEIPGQFMSYVDAHNIEPLAKQNPKYNAGSYDAGDAKDDDEKQLEEQQIDYNIQEDPWLNAPVPPGWKREFTEDGKPYYVSDTEKKTQWEHPAAVAFLKKIKEKEEAAKAASAETQANNAFDTFGDANWATFD